MRCIGVWADGRGDHVALAAHAPELIYSGMPA